MLTRSARIAHVAFRILTVLACAPAAHAFQACSIERVSLSTSGQETAPGSPPMSLGALSGDGRFVVWVTDAPNLVPNDTNGGYDVFLRDCNLATTERVSLDEFGLEGPNWSGNYGLDVSGDGRYVVFTSASVLTSNDGQAFWDVYVRDRATSQTILVSQNAQGVAANAHALDPAISANGRYVVFLSSASDLVASDTNGVEDAFVRDLQTGVTERVSISSAGAQGTTSSTGHVYTPAAISADGRFVAYASWLSNLVPDDTNNAGSSGQDIFLRDRLLGTTVRVDVATSGAQLMGGNASRPSITLDGRRVTFEAVGSGLVPGATGTPTVYQRDLQTGETTRESVSTAGEPAALSDRGHASADGRYVYFSSLSSQIVEGDTNGWHDVFRRDRTLGVTTRIQAGGVQGDSVSKCLDVSDDGSVVLFASYATNLVSNDTNGNEDLFVATSGPLPFDSYCFGTAAACPCGNAGGQLAGCDNSLATGGGRLVATGEARLAADTLVLRGSAMPNSSALYLQGTQRTNGGAGITFGDGLRCIGGSILRLGIAGNIDGASRHPGAGDAAVSVRGQVTLPGTREYQVWYRNAASFCAPATFNFTNGIGVSWQL